MARLGAVTAAGARLGRLGHGGVRRAAAEPPEQPEAAKQPVKEALLVAVLRRLRRAAAAAAARTARRRARPSSSATRSCARRRSPRSWSGRTASRHVLEAGVQQAPGSYPFTFDELRRRGHLALERAGHRRPRPRLDRRPHVPVRHDAARAHRARPRADTRSVRFTLARPANVACRIETTNGVVVRDAAAGEPAGRARSRSSGTARCRRARARTAAPYVAQVSRRAGSGRRTSLVQFTVQAAG